MKMFEEFVQDYEMEKIVNEMMNRIKYWFQEGSFSMSSTKVDQSKSSTPGASKKSIICNFADSEFYYQMIIRFYVEDLENCDVIIKKYDPSRIDEPGGGEPVWIEELTNDKQVKIDDVQENFIMETISKKNDSFKENPDENKIEVPKEKQPQPAQKAQGSPGMTTPGAAPMPGMMPGGEVPPAQGAAPFPEAAPPPQGGAPAVF